MRPEETAREPEHEPEPVDTLTAPHEPVVETPSTVGLWRHVLAGPSLWLAHFAVVYLLAEAACEAERTGGMDVLDPSTLRVVVVVATIVAAGTAVVAAIWSWRRSRRPDASGLLWAATLASTGAALTILAVGLPILWIGPC